MYLIHWLVKNIRLPCFFNAQQENVYPFHYHALCLCVPLVSLAAYYVHQHCHCCLLHCWNCLLLSTRNDFARRDNSLSELIILWLLVSVNVAVLIIVVLYSPLWKEGPLTALPAALKSCLSSKVVVSRIRIYKSASIYVIKALSLFSARVDQNLAISLCCHLKRLSATRWTRAEFLRSQS